MAMSQDSMETNVLQLKTLLIETISRSLEIAQVPGILFSGGLDSSIISTLVKSLISKPLTLFVAGSKIAKDFHTAEVAARILNLPLKKIIINLDEIKQIIPTILNIVGKPDVLQVSLAIPLYLSTICAQQNGVTTLFSGLGADELFGGYARHERCFRQFGPQGAMAEMETDFKRLSQETLPFQSKIVKHHGVEYTAPFLNRKVLKFAKALPLRFKLHRSNQQVIRKYILRVLATHLDLPQQISNIPKRAAQYGSGAHQLLAQLAQQYWQTRVSSLSHRATRSKARIQHYLLDLIKSD